MNIYNRMILFVQCVFSISIFFILFFALYTHRMVFYWSAPNHDRSRQFISSSCTVFVVLLFSYKKYCVGGGVGLNAKQLNFDREAVEER